MDLWVRFKDGHVLSISTVWSCFMSNVYHEHSTTFHSNIQLSPSYPNANNANTLIQSFHEQFLTYLINPDNLYNGFRKKFR